MEVVAVDEPGAERVVQVHAALKRAVEAEIARVVVLDDEQAVVPRVPRLADVNPPPPSPTSAGSSLRGVRTSRSR